MLRHPVFLSVVLELRNQESLLEKIITEILVTINTLVTDFEIIIIDNSSDDNSLEILKGLTNSSGLQNLQVYALTKRIDHDTACWVGLENALGDYIAIIDPLNDDIKFLSVMLEKALLGSDVIFAHNTVQAKQSLFYKAGYSILSSLFKVFTGLNLSKDAPQYRILNKKVVNFILRHPQPAVTYRHLPATGGFSRINLRYSFRSENSRKKKLFDSLERGIRLLVSTTRLPMRLVTTLSLFGAIANVIYSFYVINVAIFKEDVASGWVSLSLQQSGMFFLISLVLLVLGEYILHMTTLNSEGPLYHIGQEFTSSRMTRYEKLNVEENYTTEGDRES